MLSKDEIKALPVLLQDFLRYQGVIKNRSEKTVVAYALDLRMFFRFLVREKGLVSKDIPFEEIDISTLGIEFFRDISLQDAYSFMTYMKFERNNSATSQARRTVSIRGFYKYLSINQRLIDENPMLGLETPRIKKSLPKHLSLEQSHELLDSIDGKNRERDYCIITLFLNCGLRLSELVSLDVTNILSDGTMKVLGKGNKERIVYLNNACKTSIDEYKKARARQAKANEKALFLSNRGQRISNRTVQHIVSSFIKKAGLGGQGFSVHKLRHTAATLMYQYGNVDLLVLKEVLGHENLGTTEIYTHIHDEQMKKAADANPLAKVRQKSSREKTSSDLNKDKE